MQNVPVSQMLIAQTDLLKIASEYTHLDRYFPRFFARKSTQLVHFGISAWLYAMYICIRVGMSEWVCMWCFFLFEYKIECGSSLAYYKSAVFSLVMPTLYERLFDYAQ